MGLLFKEEKRRGGWNERDARFNEYTVLRATPITKVFMGFVGAAACVGAVFGVVSDGHMDLFGDPGHVISQDEAIAKAEAEYGEVFSTADPADKFTLQYGTSSTVTVDMNTTGNGILGLVHGEVADVNFNNACLNGTAYDIDGGEINGHIGGLFVHGYIDGEVPTAAAYAEVSTSDPDMLTVHSGHANSVDLTFSGVTGDRLVPVGDETQGILDTYGCVTGASFVGFPAE